MQLDLWIGLFALMGALLLARAIVSKVKGKRKVLRVSPETIEASKGIVVKYLPLVEDNSKGLRDILDLPCEKRQVKNALKVMAYCFTRQRQHKELTRVRDAFVALHRFQDGNLKDERIISAAKKERRRLTQEIKDYLAKHFA